MPRHLHLDFETFSEAEINDVGAYRYAFDPSTEILCAAMALDNEYPAIWHEGMMDAAGHLLEPYWDALENPNVLIYAHNAQFEMAICQALLWKTWGIRCPDLSRFRCTMSLARRAALPAKLEMLAKVLELGNQKDSKGKSLIKKFSQLQPPKKPTKKNPLGVPVRRIYPKDDPEAFNDFLAYCQQDVRAEQEVAQKLAYFDEPINNANYSLDARINARGVPVNLVALRNAQKIIDEETAIVSERFRDLVGCEVTQGAVFLKWAKQRGFMGDNLQAETIEEFVDIYEGESDVDELVLAMRMKQSVAFASIKKVATMLACAGPHDNRIRGMQVHHGSTTGRWSDSLVQFKNMKRPADHMAAEPEKGVTWSEIAYRDICAGISREMLEICYGSPLEVISSCIRHFVHDVQRTEHDEELQDITGGPSGIKARWFEWEQKPFIDADYSAIEARIVCWLAGQEDALQEYRAQDAATTKEDKKRLDRYRIMASNIFGVHIDEVNSHPQRFIGKQSILLCGFQGGADKFRKTCEKFGYKDMPVGLEHTAVSTFRSKHKSVVRYWTDVDKAAKQAITNPGTTVNLRNVQFGVREVGGMPFLFIRLPSGRKLAYPRPRIRPSSKFEGATEIVFFGHIKGVLWGDVSTYGGKLVENITQAVAADIMANGAHKAEGAGYDIATLIHDQALSYYREGQTSEKFVQLLTDLPAWADGLPIEAEGGLVPFYKKG